MFSLSACFCFEKQIYVLKIIFSPYCQAMMSLLRPSLELARQPHLPSLSCSSWILSRRRLRLWFWLPLESWLSRYAVPEVTINLSSTSDLSSVLRTLIQILRYNLLKICSNSKRFDEYLLKLM